MRTEIVTTSSRLAEVGPAWDALWTRCDGSVFQSHGWIQAWWTSQPADGELRLCVGLGWTGDAMVAAMPLAVRQRRGVRVLEWAAKECSDYCDALAGPDAGETGEALGGIWSTVADFGGFDLVYLSHVRPDAALHGLLRGARSGVKLAPGRRSARSLQVRSECGGRPWFEGLDGATRDGHARGMRLLGAKGPVDMAVLGSEDAFEPALERMIGLKRRWLAETAQSGGIIGGDARVLRALVGELVRRRTLQIFEMHCGGDVVAALLGIVAGTRVRAFLTAYDARFDDASPESLLLIEYVIRSLDAGVTEVDLLCVEADRRFSFTNARLDLASYVGARTLAGRLALTIGERLDRVRG